MLLPLAQICATMEGNIEDLISWPPSANHWVKPLYLLEYEDKLKDSPFAIIMYE